MTRKMIYLIGPLFARSQELMDGYKAEALKAARKIAKLEATPLVPHCAILLGGFASSYEQAKNQALQDRLNLLSACDAALLLEGWDEDLDALIEKGQAKEWKVPVFEDLQALADFIREAA